MAEEMLNDQVKGQIRQVFAGLEGPVKLVVFTQGSDAPTTIECSMCSETRQLIEEVGALSEKISVEVYDLLTDSQIASFYNIDKIPAIVVLSGPEGKDHGIRFFGIPSGYEFRSLIESITLASRQRSDLSPKTMQAISKLTKPVHIQVYVTPT